MKRPIRITVVAWFGVVFGIVMLIATVAGIGMLYNGNDLYREMLEQNTLPVWLQLVEGTVMGITYLVTGIYMLKGRYWAWLILLILLSVQLLLYMIGSPYFSLSAWPMATIHLLFYAAYFYLLLSAPSRHYFIGMRQEHSIKAS